MMLEFLHKTSMPTAQRFCPTAIPFGSAARRCSWENRIFCYQMTVRFEVLLAEFLWFRGKSQMRLCDV
jgi:hypothetical protein